MADAAGGCGVVLESPQEALHLRFDQTVMGARLVLLAVFAVCEWLCPSFHVGGCHCLLCKSLL